jgi:hypothetical protein
MILIMQRTIEYLTQLSQTNTDPEIMVKMANIWKGVTQDDVKETDCGIKYVKKKE